MVAPDEPATAPGSPLPRTGTAATVDRFANPDDAWYVDLVGGRTYRMNFVTKGDGCADVELFPAAPRLRQRQPDQAPVLRPHTVFVASATGRYPILVSAPRGLPRRPRTTGSGSGWRWPTTPLPGGRSPSTRRCGGRLNGSELDALDLYRFGVARRSDMRIHLEHQGATSS